MSPNYFKAMLDHLIDLCTDNCNNLEIKEVVNSLERHYTSVYNKSNKRYDFLNQLQLLDLYEFYNNGLITIKEDN